MKFTTFCFCYTRYATPFGLTSEYAHPAEILFLGFATVIGPAITGPHLITLYLWISLRILETVEAHSGYHFPWSPSNFLPLYGGSVHSFTYSSVLHVVNDVLIVASVLFPGLIFMITIIDCSTQSLETTHRLSFTWTGKASIHCLLH